MIRPYITLLRPFTLLMPLIASQVMCILSFQEQKAYFSEIPPLLDHNITLFLVTLCVGLSASILNGASNVINQVYDIDIDRIAKPERPLPQGLVSLDKARLFTYALYILAFFFYGFAFLLSQRFFLPLVAFFGGVICTWFYSVPPLRFKSRLWLSNISIAFARGFLINIAAWLGSNPLQTLVPWVIAISLFIYLIGAVSLKDYSDIEGDRTYGVLNLPIYYGEKKATKIISIFLIFPFIFLIIIYFSLPSFFKQHYYTVFFLCFYLLWNIYIIILLLNASGVKENYLKAWKQMYFFMIFFYLSLLCLV